jgi:hypothetical protein
MGRRLETEGRLGLVGVSAAQQTIDDLKHSEAASERGKRIDAGEKAQGFSTMPIPTKSSGGFPEHRRAISPCWRCLQLRIRRGSREERWGFVEGADAGLRMCGRKWGEAGLRFRFPEKEGGSWRR